MKTIKTYVMSTLTSSREIQATSKKQAVKLFKQQLKGLISDSDVITIK